MCGIALTVAAAAQTALQTAQTASANASSALEEAQTASSAVSTLGAALQTKADRFPHPYALDGANLKDVFGTAAAFHAAVAAEDFSHIRVGDYWTISLTGNYRDYGIGTNAGEYQQKSFSSATVILEVAAINPYWKYGDSGSISTGTPHILFISRDCLPNRMKFLKAANVYEDSTSTNPWNSSAIYRTLNDPDYGVVNLVSATDIGAYIYGGSDGNGMRYNGEVKGQAYYTAWTHRGKLFLPTEGEVFGREVFGIQYRNALNRIPIFAGSMRHMIKGQGAGGNRGGWYTCSVSKTNDYVYGIIESGNFADLPIDGIYFCAPLCFLVT